MNPNSQNTEGDKPLHNRRSIRLKGYDYSKEGAYFITICVKDRIHFFGKIENGEMILNNAGKMIDKWWQKIPEKFPDIELGDYQIMPNHFHAIVINIGMGNAFVRADPRVRPSDKSPNDIIVRADPRVRPETNHPIPMNHPIILLGRHMGLPLPMPPIWTIYWSNTRVRPYTVLCNGLKQ